MWKRPDVRLATCSPVNNRWNRKRTSTPVHGILGGSFLRQDFILVTKRGRVLAINVSEKCSRILRHCREFLLRRERNTVPWLCLAWYEDGVDTDSSNK